ncbi:MAG TPA: hypothetical protein VL988_12135 [Solirubrobacteraceae bacterium]|nr:hypothetical protein [Solirubrobacteraceae bacterium]
MAWLWTACLALMLAAWCGPLSSAASAELPISVAGAVGTVETVDAGAAKQLAATAQGITGASADAVPQAAAAPVQQVAATGTAAVSETLQRGEQAAAAAMPASQSSAKSSGEEQPTAHERSTAPGQPASSGPGPHDGSVATLVSEAHAPASATKKQLATLLATAHAKHELLQARPVPAPAKVLAGVARDTLAQVTHTAHDVLLPALAPLLTSSLTEPLLAVTAPLRALPALPWEQALQPLEALSPALLLDPQPGSGAPSSLPALVPAAAPSSAPTTTAPAADPVASLLATTSGGTGGARRIPGAPDAPGRPAIVTAATSTAGATAQAGTPAGAHSSPAPGTSPARQLPKPAPVAPGGLAPASSGAPGPAVPLLLALAAVMALAVTPTKRRLRLLGGSWLLTPPGLIPVHPD